MAAIETWSYDNTFGAGMLGVYGCPTAQADLPDGSMVFLLVDYKNPYVFLVHLSADRTTPTLLWRYTFTGISQYSGQQCDLAVDAAGNIYVAFLTDIDDSRIRLMAFTKGTGDTWTQPGGVPTADNGTAGQATTVTAMAIPVTSFSNMSAIRMVWSAAGGGGTAGAGFLLCAIANYQPASSTINGYATIDAGAALAGTATTATNQAVSPAFLSTTTVGSVVDLAPATPGAVSGLSLASGTGTTATTLEVGKWTINSSGALTTNANVGSITGTACKSFLAATSNQAPPTAQILSLDGGTHWLVTYPTSTGTFGTAVATVSAVTVTSAMPTAPNGLSGLNWTTTVDGTAGAAYVDPTTTNTVWVVFPNTVLVGGIPLNNGGFISRIRAVVTPATPAVTWDTTISQVDTSPTTIVYGAQQPFPVVGLPVRVISNPTSGVVDVMAQTNNGVPGTNLAYIFGTSVLAAPQPIAPTLLTPTNGALADLAAGQTFTWTPDGYSTQPWYSFERMGPSGLTEWWNGTTFQIPECWINTTTTDVVFPAEVWADFDTAYDWWVRTLNQWLVPSLQPSPFNVTGVAAPVVSPSASGLSTSTPTISWTIVPGSFSTTQASYRVIIGTSGFVPITGASLYDTGVDTSRIVASVKSGALLANGNYDAYVIVVMSDGSTNGTAAKVSFTVSITGAPSTPTITALADTSLDRVLLTVTGTGSNTAFVQYSDDAGTTWTQVRNTNDSPADYAYLQLAGGVGTVYDYELTPGAQRTYRGAQVNNVGTFSAYSSTVTATLTPTEWWWKNPLFPTENMIVVVQPPFKTKIMETLGEYRPLVEPGVSSFPVFSSGGVQGVDGTIEVLTITKAQFASLVTLYRYAGTTLLQSPFGYQWYIRVNAPRQPIQDPGTATNPRRVTTISYAEVAKPVIVPILPTTVPVQSQRAVARIKTAVTTTQTAHASIVG